MAAPGIYRVNTQSSPLWIRQFCPVALVSETTAAGTTRNLVCPDNRDPHTSFDATWSTAKVQAVPPGQKVKVVDDREIAYPVGNVSITFVPVSVQSANYSNQMVRGWMAKEFLVFDSAAAADAPLPQVDVNAASTPGTGADLEDPADQGTAKTETPPAPKRNWVVPAVIGALAFGGLLWYLSSKKTEKRALQLPAEDMDFEPNFQPAMAGLRRTRKRRRRARR